jgi:hypothetical protein
MKTTDLTERLWRAVNASKQNQLAVAEGRLYAALEAALKTYAAEARLEWAALGCAFASREITETLPLSAAEQWFYSRLHQALLACEDRACLGHPAPERRCMICEKPISQCCC